MSLRRSSSTRWTARSLRLAWIALAALPAAAQGQVWIRQLGTTVDDQVTAAAPDGAGGVFVSGTTRGSLGGSNAGVDDVWLARYDGTGNQLWALQLGTTVADRLLGATADGTGGVYVSGFTSGSLAGPSAGGFDAWLARYDGGGSQVWIRQFGSEVSDQVLASAADGSGGVYVSGSTWGTIGASYAGATDAWLARFDAAGNRLWARQLGTSAHDDASAAAPDGAGGVYVSGMTAGSLGGIFAGGSSDVWIARYDGAGNQLWVRQLGTAFPDIGGAAAPDAAGGVYVGGTTWGSLGGATAGWPDAWLARFDGAGNFVWARQLGTHVEDTLTAMAPHPSGDVYAIGDTNYELGGLKAGGGDPWIARYDSSGSQVWIGQLGSVAADKPLAATADGSGGLYLGGWTQGSFGGPHAGQRDAWLARHDGGCATAATYCTATQLVCKPLISASGLPSASAGSGFFVYATTFVRSQPGLFVYGTSGQQAVPFQGGTLCVKPPLVRTAIQNSGGKDVCGGTFSLDFNAYIASGKDPSLVAGVAVDGQYWSRHPYFPPPNNVLMSAGVHFVICP